MNDNYSHNALPKGTKIQEFVIDRVLGSGSFGIVYVAENTYFEEIVAIKEFLPIDLAYRKEGTTVVPLSSDTESLYEYALQNFLKEARILRELARKQRHPNIVEVTQYVEDRGTAYMVMTYEKGRTLLKFMEEHGTFTEQELIKILKPLLDGLERVHGESVWHRDIKPGNILIREDGSPVLIDFGAARREAGSGEKSKIAAFTPKYAAPEQVFSAMGEQGPWTDIYSLGATLYLGVTGDAPVNALDRLQGLEYVPADRAAKGVYSTGFLSAIDAALNLKPEDRPQTINEWRQLFGLEFQATGDEGDEETRIAPRPELHPEPPKVRKRMWLAIVIMLFFLTAAASVTLFFKPGIIDWLKTIIAPLPTTEPVTDQMYPARIMADVRQVLSEFDCAYVSPALSHGHLALSGSVAGADDLLQVRLRLSQVGGVTSVEDDLVIHPRPFCDMMTLLEHYNVPVPSDLDQIGLRTDKADNQYKEGEFLVVNAVGAFDGFLYIDFLDPDGNIVHMLPSPVSENNEVRAGQQIVIGKGKRRYEILPPHGRNVIVAITSQQPLFDTKRPEIESAEEYLSALNEALQRVGQKNPVADSLAVAFRFVDTHP